MNCSDAQVEGIIRSFKTLGVQKCGVTHCTGDRPIELFKAAYGTDFIPMGAGRVVTVQ
jgi:7,8-dihydropterin-6-yl-methyl-4-(beta-D-ribofuranosyl)aminobenzene 5'-phosphate synthase